MVESSSSSPSGASKRNRDPEDEAYLDNFHSHKRYLSEIMASSLNGLTVGESILDNLIESPARPETMSYPRDDISLQYSPMSEDSDDARYSETPLHTSLGPSDSLPTSPSSPHRHQRPLNGSNTSYPSLSCNLTAVACSQPRRGSDSEGRFPSSPSDICHSADLRRAALLRSVHMRVHPPAPPSYDAPFSPEQESPQNMEAEDQACSCRKSLVVDCTCENEQQSANPSSFAEACTSSKVLGSDVNREKPRRVLDVDGKEELCEEAFERSDYERQDVLSSRRSILGGSIKSHVNLRK